MGDIYDNYDVHNAAYRGDVHLLKSLLITGDSVTTYNRKGNTPLVSAIVGYGNEREKMNIINLLMKYGGDINAINKDGDSILHIAVKATFCQTISNKIIQLLIDYGADKTLTNNSGYTPSDVAFQLNNVKLGTLLTLYDKPLERRTKRLSSWQPSWQPTAQRSHSMDVIGETEKKRPGIFRSISNLINPKSSSQKLSDSEKSLDNIPKMERKKSFIKRSLFKSKSNESVLMRADKIKDGKFKEISKNRDYFHYPDKRKSCRKSYPQKEGIFDNKEQKFGTLNTSEHFTWKDSTQKDSAFKNNDSRKLNDIQKFTDKLKTKEMWRNNKQMHKYDGMWKLDQIQMTPGNAMTSSNTMKNNTKKAQKDKENYANQRKYNSLLRCQDIQKDEDAKNSMNSTIIQRNGNTLKIKEVWKLSDMQNYVDRWKVGSEQRDKDGWKNEEQWHNMVKNKDNMRHNDKRKCSDTINKRNYTQLNLREAEIKTTKKIGRYSIPEINNIETFSNMQDNNTKNQNLDEEKSPYIRKIHDICYSNDLDLDMPGGHHCPFCRYSCHANEIIFECSNGHVYEACCKNKEKKDQCAVCSVAFSKRNLNKLVSQETFANYRI